jgi:hypothetical protein
MLHSSFELPHSQVDLRFRFHISWRELSPIYNLFSSSFCSGLYSLFLISFPYSFLFFFINLFISVPLFLCLSVLVETDNIQIISLFIIATDRNQETSLNVDMKHDLMVG